MDNILTAVRDGHHRLPGRAGAPRLDGNGGLIGPGDVQWMTAASGILHEEFHSKEFTRKGGTLEMVQLWVNLPRKDKKEPPGYQTLLNQGIPSVCLPDGAGAVRVIAGDYQGQKGPARTFTPINIWDLRLAQGKTTTLTLPEGHTVALVRPARNGSRQRRTDRARSAARAVRSRRRRHNA